MKPSKIAAVAGVRVNSGWFSVHFGKTRHFCRRFGILEMPYNGPVLPAYRNAWTAFRLTCLESLSFCP